MDTLTLPTRLLNGYGVANPRNFNRRPRLYAYVAHGVLHVGHRQFIDNAFAQGCWKILLDAQPASFPDGHVALGQRPIGYQEREGLLEHVGTIRGIEPCASAHGVVPVPPDKVR